MERCRAWLRIAALCLVTMSFASSASAQAGKYPDKPVTIITDAGPGSTPDVVARFVADGLTASWRQQVVVVVVPRPGANGSIAVRAAAEALPDGYTLFMPALSTFVSKRG